MPLGPFHDWNSCISAQKRKGYSDDAAKGICGKIEQNTIAARKASTPAVVKYEDNNDHLYLKAFLLNQDINKRYWGVSQSSLERNASSFIGKPLILNWNEAQNVFDHPDIPLNALEHKADENGFVSIADYVDHWLAYQEPYRIGTIVDVVNKGSTYSAIIEVTDPDAKRAFRKHELPLFVSPGVAHLNPYHESATSMEDWTGIHLAIVTNPAYTIQKAYVSNQCNGDSDSCLLQLREASLSQSRYNYNDSPNLVYGQCGFCRKKALDAYFEQVNFPIDPSITGVLHWASTYQEFIDSSHNLKAQTQNNLSTPETNNSSTASVVAPTTEQSPSQTNQHNDNQLTNPSTIAEQAYKVANMEKCVQVFAQHGINPEQAQQICQIAMETMTESSQTGNPAGNNQSNCPPVSGQFGSVQEIEKELEKKQATIEKLAEELKSYKKNVKTEAERIAELETQVQTFQLEKKHSVLDKYLAAHIQDEAIRQEKVKKFAAKDLTVEDLREIYEDIPAKASATPAKTASVSEQKETPKGKVQLRTASTDESPQQNDTNNKSNKIKDTNSKLVSSFFANSGGN